MAKLVLDLIATGVLLLYTRTLDALADAARYASSAALVSGSLVDASPLVHSLAALVLLLGAVVLSVVKPSGTTRHGARQEVAAAGRQDRS